MADEQNTPNKQAANEAAAPSYKSWCNMCVTYRLKIRVRRILEQNPQIGVNANVGARKLSDADYEVGKFRIEAQSDSGEEDAEARIQFIAELEYCGVFRLQNIAEPDIKPVLLIEAPRQLSPSPAVSWPMPP